MSRDCLRQVCKDETPHNLLPLITPRLIQNVEEAAVPGQCQLNVGVSDCLIAAPVLSQLLFTADDERHEIAFALGGISEPGSGWNASAVVQRIP